MHRDHQPDRASGRGVAQAVRVALLFLALALPVAAQEPAGIRVMWRGPVLDEEFAHVAADGRPAHVVLDEPAMGDRAATFRVVRDDGADAFVVVRSPKREDALADTLDACDARAARLVTADEAFSKTAEIEMVRPTDLRLERRA